MAAIISKDVSVPVPDGTTMGAYLARPEGDGPFPGILVFQEIFGVNPWVRSVADRFAQAGFIALAPDLFHRTAPGFQSGYADYGPGIAQAQQMTDQAVAADLKGSYDWLMSDPFTDADRIASVGFCMGGRVSVRANANLPLQAAISFYGGGLAQTIHAQADKQHGPLLLLWGGRDEHIPLADVASVAEALQKAGKTYTNVVFGDADHGFFRDGWASYHAASAEQAWPLVLAFLEAHLGE